MCVNIHKSKQSTRNMFFPSSSPFLTLYASTQHNSMYITELKKTCLHLWLYNFSPKLNCSILFNIICIFVFYVYIKIYAIFPVFFYLITLTFYIHASFNTSSSNIWCNIKTFSLNICFYKGVQDLEAFYTKL